MTLSATSQRVSYSGDNVTTSFAFAFPLWAASEMKVYVRSSAGVETLKTLTTHYTLSPSSYPATSGNVVFLSAPTSTETVVLVRSQALTQALDLVNGDPMPSDLIERRFDILVGMTQNLDEKFGRTLLQQASAVNRDLALPEPSSTTANQILGVNSGGTAYELKIPAAIPLTAVSAFMASLLDDADAATARVTLGLLDSIVIAASDETSAITTGTAKVTFYMPYAMTVTEVFAGLSTAQASGTIFTVDINDSGTTILSTKLTIDNTEDTSLTAATPPVISDTALAKGAKITIDVDQIGNGSAKGLKVVISGYRA